MTSPVDRSRDMMTPSPISDNILSVLGSRSSFTSPVSDILGKRWSGLFGGKTLLLLNICVAATLWLKDVTALKPFNTKTSGIGSGNILYFFAHGKNLW